MGRPFPETEAIACARANPAQNDFARAFFCPRSFSKQRSHLIAKISFPTFDILTIKYQDGSKYCLCVYEMAIYRIFPFPYIAHVNSFCITLLKLSME